MTALSVGPPSAEDVLRKALSVTADQAVLLWDEGFDRLDPPGVATVLAAAVRRLQALGTPVDVLLTGRQAADWEHGQTGGMVAEALGWPCLSFVSQLRSASGEDLEARREVEDGFQVILARPPVVVTVTNDATNRLRLAKVRDVLRAHRTSIPVWGRADLGLEGEHLAPWTDVVDLRVPDREGRCEFIEGETPKEKATALAQRLRELRVL